MTKNDSTAKDPNIVLNFEIKSEKPKRLKRLLKALRCQADKDGKLVFESGDGDFTPRTSYSISATLVEHKSQTKMSRLKSVSEDADSDTKLCVVLSSFGEDNTLAQAYNALSEICDNKRVTRGLHARVFGDATEAYSSAGLRELGCKNTLDIRNGKAQLTRTLTL